MESDTPLVRIDPNAPMPLAGQISQQLAWLIASGELERDAQLPPVRRMAEELGVNLHTVRAAYRQLEADGLVTIRQGRRATVLAYDRTRAALASPDLPSFTVGVIIPAFAPFYAPMLDGIESASAHHRALVFTCNAHESPDAVLTYLDRLIARQVDGIIITFPGLPPGTPLPPPGRRPSMVFVDCPDAPGPGVEFDLEGSILQATSHLIEHGHQRIAYITPPIGAANVAPKYRGYERALHTAGLAVDAQLVVPVADFTIEAGFEGARRLIDLPDCPTGVVAANDMLALGAAHAIAERGLRIPEDIALIGNDDIDLAAIVRPALSTVALPARRAGVTAASMLQLLIAGQSPDPDHVVLDTSLVRRETCGCDDWQPPSYRGIGAAGPASP